MKIAVTSTLKEFDKTPIKTGDKEYTVRDAMGQALLADNPKLPQTDIERFDDALLAYRIRDNDEVELTSEEAARIKKSIGVNCPKIIIGQIWPLLDGK